MNIRRKFHITNILYLAVAKWPYIYRENQRKFQSLGIICTDNILLLHLYTNKLWNHLHRDSSLLNMVEATVPNKHQLIPHCSKITDCCTQLLPSGARIGNYKTYLIYEYKISTQF